jgi:hypothetical protein
MKQFFTLLTLAILSLSTSTANSQNVNEGFETPSEVTSLVNSCWTFNGFNYSGVAPLTNTGSMVSQIGTLSEIITPELQVPNTLTISFKYTILSSVSGVKKLQIFLMIGAVKTKIEMFNLSGGTASGNYSASFTNANTPGQNINGSRKIIIEVSENTSVKIDELVINAPYTYSGGCAFENIILPLKLLSFQGSLNNSKAQLKWSVAENETGDHFEIEKSADGRNFTSVAMVFTTSKVGADNYTFNETGELSGTGYYRLTMVNKNGSTSQSRIIVLKNEKAVPGSNSLVIAQSAGASLSFNYASSKTGLYNLNVYTINGTRLFTTAINMQRGNNAGSLRVDGLASSGVYILDVINGADRSITKFLK